ncbi:hypothetical protein BQ8794_40164 [Mesorhizobium prunaredense]|uniref:Uncharacterized protein n=1 Tax=Mesorhizobium prunaredense TaxID=1631249 RepID=A0A1R3VFF1_9HYPH|nr:hypothetical protein BQ8794_40164 [Mesorhizobium prunaredense]
MRRLAPDYRTIAAFRHDNPEAIMTLFPAPHHRAWYRTESA